RLDGAERKRRRQVLEAMRRGLESSAARYECSGVSRPDAERSAGEEWGAADVLARDFGYESLRFGQRRLSYLVLVTLPVLGGMWGVLLLAGPGAPWPAVPIEVEIAGRLLSLVAVSALAASVYTLASQRWWARIRYRASMFAGGGLAVAVAVALML